MRLTSPEHVAPVDPEAHPLVFCGARGECLRISVLEHDLIRVQHLPDGEPRLDRTWMVVDGSGDTPREGRPRDDLSPFSRPHFHRQMQGDILHIQTEALRLAVVPGRFHIAWADAQGRALAADLPDGAYAYDRAGRAVYHYLRRFSDEHYYGFGERAGPLDKAGRRMRMVTMDAMAYDAEHSDPLYKHFPFYITFRPDLGAAYGLFYDNLSTSVFDMGKEIDAFRGPYRCYRADDGDIDCYFIYGPSIPEVVQKFARLTGRPALPPRWSLGYLGSTMAYAEAPDAQAQHAQFARLCQENDIPCDLFHLSSGYTTAEDGSRCVFTWNRGKFPEPQKLADDFHAAGIRLTANVKPHLLQSHPRYEEVAGLGAFIQKADEDVPETIDYWSGGVGEHAPASLVDFTNPAGFGWWQQQIKDAILCYGIDSVWNDNNEFEIWDDAARCHGFGREIPAGMARPLQTLLMGRASYKALQAHAPDRRPFVISRSGCPGIQRYAQTWSGDNTTSWHTLRYNIPMGLGLSLSGAPNIGHDVGGFWGPRPDPELFIRWVQNGIFHPRFTIHSANTDGTTTEPWMYPEVLPIVRDLIHFRRCLIPYLYTLVFQAAQTGAPIIRPMVYHFANDPNCHTESFDFMLGPSLLVASVLEPGARARCVYLPRGTMWCDFHTGVWYDGGQSVELAAPLERIPLLVPAGGMIPLAAPDGAREVRLFPHPERGRGEFAFIEDDGIRPIRSANDYTKISIAVDAEPGRVTLNVAQEGRYTLPYRDMAFVLPDGEKRPLTVNKKTYGKT